MSAIYLAIIYNTKLIHTSTHTSNDDLNNVASQLNSHAAVFISTFLRKLNVTKKRNKCVQTQ